MSVGYRFLSCRSKPPYGGLRTPRGQTRVSTYVRAAKAAARSVSRSSTALACSGSSVHLDTHTVDRHQPAKQRTPCATHLRATLARAVVGSAVTATGAGTGVLPNESGRWRRRAGTRARTCTCTRERCCGWAAATGHDARGCIVARLATLCARAPVFAVGTSRWQAGTIVVATAAGGVRIGVMIILGGGSCTSGSDHANCVGPKPSSVAGGAGRNVRGNEREQRLVHETKGRAARG